MHLLSGSTWPTNTSTAPAGTGVKFAVNSDAHATAHLAFMRYGVGTAQRGWLTTDDVINTWPLRRLRAFPEKEADTMADATADATVKILLDRYGRTYADEAGIRLADRPAPLCQLLVLATLLSARITAGVAV